MDEHPASTAPADPETLAQAIETLRLFCGVVLLSFLKEGGSLRETIIRNFIGRAMACLDSIFLVWQTGSEQDAWILHRALLDRLFHLHAIATQDQFSAFEDYTFLELYEARERLLSIAEMQTKIPSSLRALQRSNRARYVALKSKGPRWHRPRAKDVAKDMEMGFLYHLGYDAASTHVHPMASDGEVDVQRIVRPSEQHALPDPTVVRNSILALTVLVQEGLNASNLQWRTIVYDFLDQAREFLGDGNPSFHATFYKITKMWPRMGLYCVPRSTPEPGPGL